MVAIIVTMIHKNAFGFKTCNFRIRSNFKKKKQHFSYSVKLNTFGKFQFNTLRVEKAFA